MTKDSDKATQHTPGPWVVTGPNIRSDHSEGPGWASALLFVQQNPFANCERDEAEWRANAALVAAAPDLLAAAQAALVALEAYGDVSEARDILRSAVMIATSDGAEVA